MRLDSGARRRTPPASAPGPTYVLDFGRQLSGPPKLSVSGPAGSTVTLIPAEVANADGTINIGSTGASATNEIRFGGEAASSQGSMPPRRHRRLN